MAEATALQDGFALAPGAASPFVMSDLDQASLDATRSALERMGLPADVRAAITPHTVLIVMTHASNVVGTIQDAAAVGRIAREHDVLFCLDAAQTAGILPISIQQMQVDLLAMPGHKSLLGPTGDPWLNR